MKAKHFTSLFIIILWSCSSKDTNEIDRLAEKYHTMKTYEMPSSHGKVMANVRIDNNADHLPFKISLVGNDTNAAALSEIISLLIGEKIKNGYRSVGDTENYTIPYMRARLSNSEYIFKKDSLIFGVFTKYNSNKYFPNLSWDFTIINADESRRFGKSSKIDF